MLSQRLCDSVVLGDIGSVPVESHVKPTGTTVVPPRAPTVVPVPSSYEQHGASVKTEPPKRKRRRKRKPQLPGKTAKMNDRHFVVHNYHDHAADAPEPEPVPQDLSKPRRRGGVAIAFPLKLHSMLDKIEEDGLAHVISWQPHGRAFLIHKPKEFADQVMPKYFKQTKLTSFQRQLNLYGFNRITSGNDTGAYYNELFLRGKVFLSKRMVRTKVKGTGFKAASSPDNEPNFYEMPFVTVTRDQPEARAVVKQERVLKQEEIAPQRIEPPSIVPSQFAWIDHTPELGTSNVVSCSSSEGTMESDDVLEDAVNEMLFDDESVNRDDIMRDFAVMWNPTSGTPVPPRIGSSFMDIEPIADPFGKTVDTIENDDQLGELLESLLKD